ncbi:MAG TPA: coproporphyrinogen III oxidase, partial [Chitinophagaceae bacterium]|nr:coproporphyrinogen III oxidase [Chitinophagaceae bacterium]
MAGIYIHIPFCKQACHYCNFHFATSLRYKNELVTALLKELGLQKNFLQASPVESIYFGGGTPSLCTVEEVQHIIETVRSLYNVTKEAELTLEA